MADMWDQFPDAKAVTGKRAADMWDQFSDAAPQPKQEEGWLESAYNAVMGRQDPKFAGTGTVFEQFKSELENPTGLAATMGASDAQMGDVIAKKLGDRLIRREKDANGYDVFVTRGPDGQEQRGYLNAPGIDTQDVARGIRGALPYMVGGAAAAPLGIGRGLIANTLLQGGTSAGTSIAGDAVLTNIGSEQGIEGGKALAAGIGGAAGPVLGKVGGALWQRFVAEPRYFSRATGTLTPEGMAAAQQMGLDPQTLTGDAVKRFGQAMAADPAEAAKMVGAGQIDFNLPQTLGQRTKDGEQLMAEKAMRMGVYGTNAKDVITGLDQQQADAVAAAARNTLPKTFISGANNQPVPPNVAQHMASLPNVAMDRGGMGQALQGAMTGVRDAAKKAEGEAWDNTAPMFVKTQTQAVPDPMSAMTGTTRNVTTTPARPLLEESIKRNLGDLAAVFDEANTPVAYRMGQRLLGYIEGKAPQSALRNAFDLPSNASVDTMRKTLGLMRKDAQTPTDRAAAGAIANAYKDWMKEAADQGMLTGDLAAVAEFTKAVDVSREINQLLRPMSRGRPTAGNKIIDKVLTSDTPEHVVQAIFGTPKSGIKPGALEAIKLMRQASDKFGTPADAVDLWGGMKVAHLSTLVMNKKGELLSPTMMLGNIKEAFENQGSLVTELYSPQDRLAMQRFAKALEGIVWKDPNPSGTATGLMALLKGVFGKLMSHLPAAAQTAVEVTGVPRAYGTAVARKAVQQSAGGVPVRPPNLSPGLAASAVEAARQKDRR
jgi:hypothetical protein